MKWTVQYVVKIYDEAKLTITRTKGGWHWEGHDQMAWQPQECWGCGDEATLTKAKKAAEYWWSTGRFKKFNSEA